MTVEPPIQESRRTLGLDGFVRVTTRRGGRLLFAIALVALVALAWPEQTEIRRYPDSAYYLREVRRDDLDLHRVHARRAPGYPLFLRYTPPGARVHAQTWISLACWCLFGWMLAREVGAIFGGLFALSPLIRPWNGALLTESLAMSLLAAFLALSLALRRRLERDGAKVGDPRTLFLTAAWLATILYFACVRDVHLLALPFAALVVLPGRLRSGGAEWGRFAVVAGVLVAALLLGIHGSSVARRWTIPIYTAFHEHVFENPEALAFFRERGLPDTRYPMSPAMDVWLESGGRSDYLLWASTRLESHRIVWATLAPADASEHLLGRYFADAAPSGTPVLASVSSWVERWTALLERLTAPPRWLWLAVLSLPLFAHWRTGRAAGITCAPALAALMTYAFAFAAWWGAGSEMLRHGLVATVLYRATFCIAIAGWGAAFGPSRLGRSAH